MSKQTKFVLDSRTMQGLVGVAAGIVCLVVYIITKESSLLDAALLILVGGGSWAAHGRIRTNGEKITVHNKKTSL